MKKRKKKKWKTDFISKHGEKGKQYLARLKSEGHTSEQIEKIVGMMP